MSQKNEDFSKSVNSIASGAIFPPSLGHDLSRNASVASILFTERISHVGIDFFMTQKSEDFQEKCSLRAICSIWAALPGAQHLERCFAPAGRGEKTRRGRVVFVR